MIQSELEGARDASRERQHDGAPNARLADDGLEIPEMVLQVVAGGGRVALAPPSVAEGDTVVPLQPIEEGQCSLRRLPDPRGHEERRAVPSDSPSRGSEFGPARCGSIRRELVSPVDTAKNMTLRLAGVHQAGSSFAVARTEMK